ncbi:hypothetical protein BHE74_00026559 [Ensete ventricosum]|nr:hypothetical protein BHE74_00026559 [Ensete ventricosum]RZS06365.1 hypothetical protein BHM03_00037022 [Ensete ventricosum]
MVYSVGKKKRMGKKEYLGINPSAEQGYLASGKGRAGCGFFFLLSSISLSAFSSAMLTPFPRIEASSAGPRRANPHLFCFPGPSVASKEAKPMRTRIHASFPEKGL